MNPSDETAPAAASEPLTTETSARAESEALHPDPITGEPGAHPVGVGVGALSAGAAGAAIGAIVGPIGVLVGAAIGALAGGLAGKDFAAASEEDAASAKATIASEKTIVASAPDDANDDGFLASSAALAASPLGGSVGAPLPAMMPIGSEFGGKTGDALEDEAPMEKGVSPGATGAAVDEDVVREAAYYRFESRRGEGRHGDEAGDWFEAERSVRGGG